uniref:hypothetical protein n=1 Tax=Actinomadura rifamycini TaxID=31962 RepID=UPI003F491EE1
MTAHHDTNSSPIVPGDLFARHQTITGLRALADFLEANPAVPVEEYGQTFHLSVCDLDDASGAAVVDRVAALLGVDVCDETARGGHYTATKTFGRISYKIVHIPARAWDEYRARDSYHDSVICDRTPGDGQTPGRAA